MGRYSLVVTTVVMCSLALAACDTSDSGTAGGAAVVVTPSQTSSCTNLNGAGGDPTALPTSGLAGNLYYLTDSMPRYTHVADYITKGVQAPVTLYLNRLYTPTRPFDEGFITNSGSLVQTAAGNSLYEYFALHLESTLQLRESDTDGFYQLALLSDDGSIMQLNQTGEGYTNFINDDGTHATQLACASSAIYMNHFTKIPMKLDYYQGPRYHIALNLIWRQVASSTSNLTDPLCGQSGNSLFWDPTTTPSTPLAFNDLNFRGWNILNTENFKLPASASINPCGQTTPVTITNLNIANVTQTGATITWDSNVNANSIVTYSAYPYTVFQTSADPTLTKSHSVTLSGLTAFTLYDITVTSQADSANQATSPDTTFKTLR